MRPASLAERPLLDRSAGLAEATLRLPFGKLTEEELKTELTKAFMELFSLYPNGGPFEVSCTPLPLPPRIFFGCG